MAPLLDALLKSVGGLQDFSVIPCPVPLGRTIWFLNLLGLDLGRAWVVLGLSTESLVFLFFQAKKIVRDPRVV